MQGPELKVIKFKLTNQVTKHFPEPRLVFAAKGIMWLKSAQIEWKRPSKKSRLVLNTAATEGLLLFSEAVKGRSQRWHSSHQKSSIVTDVFMMAGDTITLESPTQNSVFITLEVERAAKQESSDHA
jgi:hypothetical protein